MAYSDANYYYNLVQKYTKIKGQYEAFNPVLKQALSDLNADFPTVKRVNNCFLRLTCELNGEGYKKADLEKIVTAIDNNLNTLRNLYNLACSEYESTISKLNDAQAKYNYYSSLSSSSSYSGSSSSGKSSGSGSSSSGKSSGSGSSGSSKPPKGSGSGRGKGGNKTGTK